MKKYITISFSILITTSIICTIPNGPGKRLPYIKGKIPYTIDSILEAGAYDARDTLEMESLWPQAKIYAFEAAPNAFKILQNKTKGHRNIFIYNMALSNRNGTATFYLSTNAEGSSSLLNPALHLDHFPTVHFNSQIESKTIILDDWAQQEGVDRIDFMWLDLQGAEYMVLSASPNLLSTVKVIYAEVNFVELYEGCVIYPLFKKWLESEGFEEIFMDPDHKTYGNSLFIRS